MSRIAALYVDGRGCYSTLPNVDIWDVNRDARRYKGPYPVVAHPPCQLWTRFAFVNYARWGGEHNKPGNDQGCFKSALTAVRKWGGVLEHPAYSYAWKEFNLPEVRSDFAIWQGSLKSGFVCEVWQSAYGHKARKKTWLYYFGSVRPEDPIWLQPPGSHQIGFHDQRGKAKNKPTISGRAASATPTKFRDYLIRLALNSNASC